MAIKILPPRWLVREILDYDPDTGLFTWRPRKRETFRNPKAFQRWNTQWAGKPAGSLKSHGELVININHVPYRAHRLAWLYIYDLPVPDIIDHIDGAPANNRISNLRAATDSGNKANSKRPKNNKTGVKGVRYHKGRYETCIMLDGVSHYLGSFTTLEEAAKARQEAAEQLHGSFVRHD